MLQNLLSDEELSQDGAPESLVTVESDQEEYEGATKVTVTFGAARRRKVPSKWLCHLCLIFTLPSSQYSYARQPSYVTDKLA